MDHRRGEAHQVAEGPQAQGRAEGAQEARAGEDAAGHASGRASGGADGSSDGDDDAHHDDRGGRVVASTARLRAGLSALRPSQAVRDGRRGLPGVGQGVLRWRHRADRRAVRLDGLLRQVPAQERHLRPRPRPREAGAAQGGAQGQLHREAGRALLGLGARRRRRRAAATPDSRRARGSDAAAVAGCAGRRRRRATATPDSRRA